jgi:subtilisin family serine protease
MERLAPQLANKINSRIIHPVIIETEANRFSEIFEELKPFAYTVNNIVDRFSPAEPQFYFLNLMDIPMFNMIACVLPREVIEDYAEDKRVAKIYPDNIMWALQYPTVTEEGVYKTIRGREKKEIQFTSTAWTKRLIGADKANSKGFTGKGVKVAVLDTGSSATHPQLRGKLLIPHRSPYPLPTLEKNGHGTWVASCVAGRQFVDDVLSRASGKVVICEGMAPDATVIPIKVLDFVVGMGSTSAIIKGVEIALKEGAGVLNLSLGGPEDAQKETDDPQFKAFEKAKEYNVISCVAAGNDGPKPGTVGSPGALSNVLTVGAYDPITGEVAEYSSRGPVPWGSIKPDCIAPGGGAPQNGIDSAIDGTLDMAGDNIKNRFSPIQGTSMSTPHVSGVVALMREAHAKLLGKILTLEEVLRMLESLGHSKSNDDGYGLISWDMYCNWMSTEYGIEL